MTRAELRAAGLSDVRIRTLVAHGVLIRLSWGIYARCDLAAQFAGNGESWKRGRGGANQSGRVRPEPGRESGRASTERGERLLRLAAALVVAGPQAVVSHHDAAVVHGLALLDRPPAGVVSLSRPLRAPASRTARPGILMHNLALPSSQVTTLDRMPVTTVARTVVDLARTTPFRSGVVVADAALAGRLTSKPELGKVIASCARWPGIERARSVVDSADGGSESPFESISRVAFRDGGLPPPELQVWVGGDDGPAGRADFLWRRHRTIAEADGAVKYSDPETARHQLQRDAALRAAGFEVVHFTWGEIMGFPHQVISAVRAAFRRAAMLRAAESAGGGGDQSGLPRAERPG